MATKNFTAKAITDLTFEWLEKHEYSRNHWRVVAQEMLEKASNHRPDAGILLAQALQNFHTIYKDKVVQKDNLLNALLTENFKRVQWEEISKKIIDSM